MSFISITNMNYFLESVATWLFNNHKHDFKDITLVFPNRRSGVFFFNGLKNLVSDKPIWSPAITTINEFINKYSKLELADTIQLLSELYLEYKKISGVSESFDDFYSWGEMLLADFNDVDKYMVNAESVFINVKNFKSIENQIDFLTDEQLNTLKRFFEAFDADKSTRIKEEFLKIWEIMLPLYMGFKQNLTDKKIGFEGMVYQNALQNIEQLNASGHSFKKVYFIGFNAITPIEEKVFSILKNIGIAGFFWDYDNYYIENHEMEAGLFQRKYINKFPPIEIGKNNSQLSGKKIKLISVPTDHGQVFSASKILSGIKSNTPSDTAIVLADEQLLLPVLGGIPNNIGNINITMGYPVNDSLSGNFVDLLIQLQQNIRTSKDNKVSFYHKNIVSILNHPFVQHICFEPSLLIVKKITDENLYYLPKDEFAEHDFFKRLFVETKSVKDFAFYLDNILQHIHEQLWFLNTENDNFLMEKEFLFKLSTLVKTLNSQLSDYNIGVQLPTYYSLLRKIMKSTRVPFEGEPISGLQIMGFLETRNLNFKNVIILSVNEGVIPSPSRSASFIPFSLRKGFGLPTSELNDAMYAYYFYRVIQSAENVWLVYNSDAGGMSTGEKSRLAYQLEYDENFKVETEIVSQTIDVISNKTITIDKKEMVWEKITEYFDEKKPHKLSPSALTAYLQCPLKFYFRSVAKIAEADEVEEVVDARIFGNIFHKAAEELYTPFFNDKLLVTEKMLLGLLKNEELIDSTITNSFAKVFYGDKTTRRFNIEGKNRLIFDVIKKYLLQMVDKDRGYAPFSVVGLEKDVSTDISINVNNETYKVRLGGQIDRLDRSDKGLRVIDYKTGADKLMFNELTDVFDTEKIKETKAVFQTFIYSYILSSELTGEPAILPMVYQVKELFNPSGSFYISSKKCDAFKTGNFQNIKVEVEKHLKEILAELFDKNKPFTQTNHLEACEYCPYKNMCGR